MVEAISAGHDVLHFQLNRKLLAQVCHVSLISPLQLKNVFLFFFKKDLAVLTRLILMFSTAF